jgi:pimeloyl-ACP methyl ester carboxylesterase
VVGVGHFRSEAAQARFLEVYRTGMAALPDISASFDVPTAFGTVRAYRFDGPADRPPVVLLPGRNASTPMWRPNLPAILKTHTAYCVDLLGEAGLSVQTRPVTGPEDQAQWLDEALAGLDLTGVHLMGVSIGGWTATNLAVHRPARIASATLLDPVLTFAPIPLATILISGAMFSPGLPDALRRRIIRWIGGGQERSDPGGGSGGQPVGDSVPEAALISASSSDFVLRQPMPKRFTDGQLRSLDLPVLAFIAGRSVMLDADRAAARARNLLPRGQVELWSQASHAINGEYPTEVAQRAATFWDQVDGERRDYGF